jgi:hypothetical protein
VEDERGRYVGHVEVLMPYKTEVETAHVIVGSSSIAVGGYTFSKDQALKLCGLIQNAIGRRPTPGDIADPFVKAAVRSHVDEPNEAWFKMAEYYGVKFNEPPPDDVDDCSPIVDERTKIIASVRTAGGLTELARVPMTFDGEQITGEGTALVAGTAAMINCNGHEIVTDPFTVATGGVVTLSFGSAGDRRYRAALWNALQTPGPIQFASPGPPPWPDAKDVDSDCSPLNCTIESGGTVTINRGRITEGPYADDGPPAERKTETWHDRPSMLR